MIVTSMTSMITREKEIIRRSGSCSSGSQGMYLWLLLLYERDTSLLHQHLVIGGQHLVIGGEATKLS